MKKRDPVVNIVNRKRKKRVRILTAIVAAIVLGLAAMIAARNSRTGVDPYQFAAEVPRGALVYAQFSDLPEMLKQWDSSRLKKDYYQTANYESFKHRHLALKLIERLGEFDSALGFDLTPSLIGSASENGAAIAIYDIGKLNIVFVSSVSESKFTKTGFAQQQKGFEERKLGDGTRYYLRMVDEKGGRERQSLTYGWVKGKFILASDEQLFLRTTANVQGNASKDSLVDDPSFKTLSQSIVPHFATVWVDQTKLNADYYFRRYWLYQNLAELKGLRNGIFDLERQDTRWIERREFLVAGAATTTAAATTADLTELRNQIPDEVPFVKVSSIENNLEGVGNILEGTIEDPLSGKHSQSSRAWSWHWFSDSDFAAPEMDAEASDEERYSSLTEDVNVSIDNPYDAGVPNTSGGGSDIKSENFPAVLQRLIAPAEPIAVVTAESPRSFRGPLFAEFRRLSILRLRNPSLLNRENFEGSILKEMTERRGVKGSDVNLKWTTHGDTASGYRELQFPMLGWSVSYAIRNNNLIVSTSDDLISKVLSSGERRDSSGLSSQFPARELTIVRFDRRKEAFDGVVGQLDAEPAEIESKSTKSDADGPAPQRQFFSGNLGSLLDVASPVSRVEIRRSGSANRMSEEIEYVFNTAAK